MDFVIEGDFLCSQLLEFVFQGGDLEVEGVNGWVEVDDGGLILFDIFLIVVDFLLVHFFEVAIRVFHFPDLLG